MANERLRNAMRTAGLEVAEFARQAEVDEKTIRRWLAKDDLVPHPRNRILITRILDADEADIWPELARQPAAPVLVERPFADLNAIHFQSTAVPDWRELAASADTQIDLLDMTLAGTLTGPRDASVLADAAGRGTPIRVLISDPDSLYLTRTPAIDQSTSMLTDLIASTHLLAPLRDAGQVTLRTFVTPPAFSILRVDDRQLITLHLAGPAESGVVFDAQREIDSGLFDRFADHYDALWDQQR